MSLPFDEGRDPNEKRQDYRSGAQWVRDDFEKNSSQFEYWRNRPLVELQIEIRKLENEDNPESKQMAQRLRQIESELHDEPRAQQSLEQQRSRIGSASPVKRGTSLPPSAISGRITGGNYPRSPNVGDMHRGYSQMSSKTQGLLAARHRAAQNQFRDLPQPQSRGIDRRIDQMRRYDTGLKRQPYNQQMRMGTDLDVDRFRSEVPQALAQNYRDLRFKSDRAREQDSKYTKLASLEVWKQRHMDKKYHPRPPQRLPRQHEFGPQPSQQYFDDWKQESKKVMPFNPVMDYFGDKTTDRPLRASKSVPESKSSLFSWKTRQTISKPTIPIVVDSNQSMGASGGRERSWSRSAPDLSEMEAGPSSVSTPRNRSSSAQSRRPPFDPERPGAGQRVASKYVNEARSYQPLPRQQRIARRRQRWPLREEERNLGIDMSENAQEWEMAQRYQTNPLLAAFGDYSRQKKGN